MPKQTMTTQCNKAFVYLKVSTRVFQSSREITPRELVLVFATFKKSFTHTENQTDYKAVAAYTFWAYFPCLGPGVTGVPGVRE